SLPTISPMKNPFLLVAFFLTASFFSQAAEQRPNVLFILADDQSPFGLEIYDPNSTLETPHLDRLAAEGMVIERACHMGSFVGAVCTPSRHMIMSGRTLWHLPIGPLAETHCPPQLEK